MVCFCTCSQSCGSLLPLICCSFAATCYCKLWLLCFYWLIFFYKMIKIYSSWIWLVDYTMYGMPFAIMIEIYTKGLSSSSDWPALILYSDWRVFVSWVWLVFHGYRHVTGRVSCVLCDVMVAAWWPWWHESLCRKCPLWDVHSGVLIG